MVSNSTSEKIKKMVARYKSSEPYTKEELEELDCDCCITTKTFYPNGNYPDPKRMSATMAKKALDTYFSEHPEDSIENYLD